jgi:hypothetical protein
MLPVGQLTDLDGPVALHRSPAAWGGAQREVLSGVFETLNTVEYAQVLPSRSLV